jgi:hypothetical protein
MTFSLFFLQLKSKTVTRLPLLGFGESRSPKGNTIAEGGGANELPIVAEGVGYPDALDPTHHQAG